jgi:hypothetical protein
MIGRMMSRGLTINERPIIDAYWQDNDRHFRSPTLVPGCSIEVKRQV